MSHCARGQAEAASLPPFQCLEEATEHLHSLGLCSQPHLQFLGWLFPAASSHRNASSSQHCSEPAPGQQTSGMLNHPRFWFCGSSDVTRTNDTLTVVSPPLSGGDFPGGFESLVCWCCVGFKCLFSIFQCLMRGRLSTGKNCGFGEPGFLVPLS